jgi:hypothetical protein
VVDKTKLEWALDTAAHGLPVFPLVWTMPNGDCSCAKGPECKSKGKHPLTEHGYKEASTDPEQIKKWWARYPKANIAIHPGKDFVYMDLDMKNGKDGIQSLADYLGQDRDSLEFMTYCVQTPSGGLHLYFKADKTYGNRTNVLSGVDVRADGGHVLAPGSTIFTINEDFEYEERPYVCLNDTRVAPVTEGIKTLLREGLERSERAQTSLVEGALDHPAAIDHIRNLLKKRRPAVQGEGGDEHTLVTIYQVRDHDISPEKCLELLTEEGGWNDRCDPPWDYQELQVKIDNAYKYAKRSPGNKGGALLEMAAEGGIDSELSEDSIMPTGMYGKDGEVLPAPPVKSDFAKFMGHLFNANDFMSLDIEYNFVVDGWVPDAGYTAMLAKRGGGKTTAIIDMMCHVACDMDWWGTAVEHGYSVVYISGEDTPGVKARLQAWCMKHLKREAMPDPNRFMIFDMAVNLLDAGEMQAYADFINVQTKHLRKIIFVIDTWQRMTTFSKGQSDEEDMQKAVRHLEALCKAFKGPSIIAVHPPAGNALKVSGSMVIENNSQAIIHIGDAEAGIRNVFTGRVKGAPEGLTKRMKIVPQPISGFTKRGRRMTGALFEYHGGTVGESRDLEASDTEMGLLKVVVEMISRIREYDPEKGKDHISMGDIAKLIFEIYDTRGSRGELGAKWFEELKIIGYTEPEILGVDRSGFKAARSPIMRQLHDLRTRYNDNIHIKGTDRVLKFSKPSGRTIHLTVGRAVALEDSHAEAPDDGDDF